LGLNHLIPYIKAQIDTYSERLIAKLEEKKEKIEEKIKEIKENEH